MDDARLLRSFVEENSHDAFQRLVTRHIDLVYSAALRRTGGDPHRAGEITQMVFTDLARKAATLLRHPLLPAWLHQATRWAAEHRWPCVAERVCGLYAELQPAASQHLDQARCTQR